MKSNGKDLKLAAQYKRLCKFQSIIKKRSFTASEKAEFAKMTGEVLGEDAKLKLEIELLEIELHAKLRKLEWLTKKRMEKN